MNNLRKQTKDDQVISTAKALIKSWKKLLPDSGGGSGGGSTPSKSAPAMDTDSSTSASKADGENKEAADAGGDSGASTPKDEPEASGNEGQSMVCVITIDKVHISCKVASSQKNISIIFF